MYICFLSHYLEIRLRCVYLKKISENCYDRINGITELEIQRKK